MDYKCVLKFYNWIACIACRLWYVWSSRKRSKYCWCGDCPCTKQTDQLDCQSLFGCLFLRITKYPECDKCGCYSDAMNGSASNDCQGGLHGADDETNLWGQTDDNDYLECNSPTNSNKGLDQGCYSIEWDNIIQAFKNMMDKDEPGKTAMIADWRKRENLFRSMCDGVNELFLV